MSNNEIKVAGSHKLRPSIKTEAMALVKEDKNIKSFNDLLEVLLKEYITKAKKRKLKG